MNKEELQKGIKDLTEKRKRLRARAMAIYLDPIDFPQEVKQSLRYLSRKKYNLQDQLQYINTKKEGNEKK